MKVFVFFCFSTVFLSHAKLPENESKRIPMVGDFGPTPYEQYLEILSISDPKIREELDNMDLELKEDEKKLEEMNHRSGKKKK